MDWTQLAVCLVGPYLPRPGGVSIQTELHAQFLQAEGARVRRVDTNLPTIRRFPGVGRWLVPVLQPGAILLRLLRALPGSRVVHVHAASYWGFMPVVVAAPVARLLGHHVVVTYHGSRAEHFLGKHGWLVRRVLRAAHTVVVLSGWTQAMFQQLGIDTKVMPILVDTGRFAYRERTVFPPVILWAKGLSLRTNPLMAVRAFARVQSEMPEARLQLAGNGALLAETRRLAKETGAQVEFLGNVPFAEIHRLYDAAGVFWNTSYADNMPDNVLEASACGLPVIATRVAGVPLIVQDDKNALLVEADDDEALAQKTLAVLRDAGLAARLGHAARQNAEQYGWPAARERLAAIYAKP
ncbi:MAG: glycosyltransferase family 4 protein [Anaerolineae bacterium]|nr:glycosyltransferase family 4 protein [Anaerolineae bacterium]